MIRQTRHTVEDPAGRELTSRELAHQLGDQAARLVHAEVALARAELLAAARQAIVGGMMLTAAAVAGAYGALALIAAVIAAIATALPVWAAALITGGALLACAGVLAWVGARRLSHATPPWQTTRDSWRSSLAELKVSPRK